MERDNYNPQGCNGFCVIGNRNDEGVILENLGLML
jgi:hypothetical protein